MSSRECHICCEKSIYFGIYGCKHEICYKCATRLIYLYKDMRCPMCKNDKEIPVFSKVKDEFKKVKERNSISLEELNKVLLERGKGVEDKYARFSSEEVLEKVRSLLMIKCKECKELIKTKKELLVHFKEKHAALLCSTCLENNHQFWYEFVSYSPESLGKHRRGQFNESGFEGHVYCPFCSAWLYNKEMAKKHCNSEHQICTVCDSTGIRLQFYKGFTALEAHYRSKHYCCDNAVCLKNYCYVYAHKSELCAHLLTRHGQEKNLEDILLKGEKNPPVFSLCDTAAGGETGESTGEDVEVPLVQQPFFPTFLKGRVNGREEEGVPSFLNREIVRDARSVNTHRKRMLVEISPAFGEEISEIIEKYILGSKSLDEMISEIEESVGKEQCLKVLNKVPFLQKQREINEFQIKYKKEIKFPVFKKAPKKDDGAKVAEKKTFKIISLTKKKS
ncbi:hypothetical protein GINT2_002297 [Glugoides intestinalis]